MITDFQREKSPVAPLLINGSPIEIVVSFKFLATTISSGLDWEANIISILKKARKRMYFLRKLKKFCLRRKILLQFYRAVIESVLCFSLSVSGLAAPSKTRRDVSAVLSRTLDESSGANCLHWRRCTSSGLFPDQNGLSQTSPIQPMACSSSCHLGGDTGR